MFLGEEPVGPLTEATDEDPDPEIRTAVDVPLPRLLDEYQEQSARYRRLVSQHDLTPTGTSTSCGSSSTGGPASETGPQRAAVNAAQADRPTTRTGPSGFLLSRTGTVSGKPGAISMQLPPLPSL